VYQHTSAQHKVTGVHIYGCTVWVCRRTPQAYGGQYKCTCTQYKTEAHSSRGIWGNLGESSSTLQVYWSFRVEYICAPSYSIIQTLFSARLSSRLVCTLVLPFPSSGGIWGNLGESGRTVQVYRSFRVCTIPVLLTCLQHLIVRFQSCSHAYNIGLHEFSPTHMLTTSDCTTSVPLTVMMLTTSDCTISVLLTCLQHLIARFQSYSHAYNI
jgi:hypothetical protein